jgi:hypothetical protein
MYYTETVNGIEKLKINIYVLISGDAAKLTRKTALPTI